MSLRCWQQVVAIATPSRRTKSLLTVLGTSLIYFAMGLYFAAGNTGVYLTSYLIYRSGSTMTLDDAIWFLSAAGFSALLLPLGGWLESRVGVRTVCALGGLLQSCGIFATYWALETSFFLVVVVYGGSFLVSLASCYTSPMVNVCKWHPKHKGLVTGIGAASMAMAPTLFTPLITALVNPNNLPPNELGLFEQDDILNRTKQSTIIQGCITLTLFIIGIILTFPAETSDQEEEKASQTKITEKPVSIDQLFAPKKQKCPEIALIKFIRLPEDESDIQLAGSFRYTREIVSPYKNTDYDIKEINELGNAEKALATINRATDNTCCSLEPKFAFKTSEFWLLSLKVLISELIFIYLLFMYKPYGQTFIKDDYFLSAVGAACAISNTLGRLSMGHIKDKLGYRAVSIPLSATTMLFVALMPVTRYMNKFFYGAAVVLAVGAVGSQYALMPSAAQDSFGDKYASINIGFVYMSTVIATVSSALLSQHLASLIGWEGMIALIACCAAIDFVSTFFMPADPSRRLVQRYKQFYSGSNNQSSGNGMQKCIKPTIIIDAA